MEKSKEQGRLIIIPETFEKTLTKREFFAAMAMQGFCMGKIGECSSESVIADLSVKQADALIEKLNKK